MRTIHSIWTGIALFLAVTLSAGLPAFGAPLHLATALSTLDRVLGADVGDVPVLEVAHKSHPPIGGLKPGAQSPKVYQQHHYRFHQRYAPTQKGYPQAHQKFHKHYSKSHRSPGIILRVYPSYNPYYYNPYYYDPYYDAPVRLSCARVLALLRHYGYRRIQAYDCSGKVYGFYAYYGGHRYKVRASAYSGQVTSRTRI